METRKLQFNLPSELIAQHPLPIRSASRLLILDRATGSLTDSRFKRLYNFLRPGDCLVLNDTKVLAAKFFAQRISGAALEGLFLEEPAKGIWQVMLKGSRKVKQGEKIFLKDRKKADFCTAEVFRKEINGTCRLKFDSGAETETILNAIGYPPLPPYIRRGDDPADAAFDRLRYQTVFARRAGAIAAPTAGLHFTKELIERLKQKEIRFAYITLHTGAGTFKPITTENIDDYKIHREQFEIDDQNSAVINLARQKKGRIIAVGTTTTRALETAMAGSQVRPISGATELFIKPGYKFKVINAMVTNFHLPKSSLLALVAAFAGLDNVLAAYNHAIEKKYRFYSYGDAMLII